jgi:hypothetical protein
MYRQSNRAARARAGVAAFALTAGSLFIAATPAFAWPVGESGDVSIANFSTKVKEGGVLTLKDAKFVNANLSEDEIVKMLTADTPEGDKRALVQKLKADKITIGSVEVTAKDGGAFHLHDFAASDVDAGKVGKLEIAGVDGSGTSDGAAVSVKSGALSIEGLDLAAALKASGAAADADQSDPIGSLARLSHLSWSGLDTPDAESGPGKTIHVAVGSIDVRSNFAGDAFKQGSTKLTGIVVEFSPDSESGKGLESLGYSRLELGLALGADYKLDAKTLSITDFTIDGAKMGSVGLKANFTDVAPQLLGSDSDGRIQALSDCGVMSLELKLVNAGLFEKTLAFYAKQAGATPEALKQQWSDSVGQLAPLFLGGAPSALKVASETQKFIASPQNLTVSVKARDGALKAADLMALGDPNTFASKLDIAAVANQ